MGNGDIVYMLDVVELWQLSEMSCMILVFCVPVVAKTFGWKRIIAPLANTLQSWWTGSRRRSAEAMERFGLGSRPRSNPLSSNIGYRNIEALESQTINALPLDVATMSPAKLDTSEEQANGPFST
jgi:hypothetical protein